MQTTLGAMWYDELPGSSRSEFVVLVAGLPMFTETFYSSANQSAVRYGQALDLSINFDAGVDATRKVPNGYPRVATISILGAMDCTTF